MPRSRGGRKKAGCSLQSAACFGLGLLIAASYYGKGHMLPAFSNYVSVAKPSGFHPYIHADESLNTTKALPSNAYIAERKHAYPESHDIKSSSKSSPSSSPLLSVFKASTKAAGKSSSLSADVSRAVEELLVKPSTEPYNFSFYGGSFASQDGQDEFVDAALAGLNRGFVVEGGAYNGEFSSNSLFLEYQRKWDCLLFEANPNLQQQIIGKHRKCHLLKGGFSPTSSVSSFKFKMGGVIGGLVDHYSENPEYRQRLDDWIENRKVDHNPEFSDKLVEAKCFPLHTVLQLLGKKTVDYWSLDTEGSEAEVVESTDFSQIEFGIITVEHNFEVKKRRRIFERLSSQKFVRIKKSQHEDDIYANPCYFVKRGLRFPYPDIPWTGFRALYGGVRSLDAQSFLHSPEPNLNSHTQKRLVSQILQPSKEPYKFDVYKVGVDTYASARGQDVWVDTVLGQATGLFAVEMGSGNGEDGSDTLWFETGRKWACLLIHSSRSLQQAALEKHRKCASLAANLCIADSPSTDCFSMYEILHALDRKTIDYWSLDDQEFGRQIIQRTDFGQVEVGLLTVRVNSDDEAHVVTEHMEQKGFSRVILREGIAYFVNPCYIATRKLPWPTRDIRKCNRLYEHYLLPCGGSTSVSAPGLLEGLDVKQGVNTQTPNYEGNAVRFLVVSNHPGVSNEVAALASKLELATHIGPFCAEAVETNPEPCSPDIFNSDRVDAIWANEDLATQLNSYRGVFITSASPLASYPFLVSHTYDKKPIIFWVGLVGRFDTRTLPWFRHELLEYEKYFLNASCCRKNVHIVAASKAELELARREHDHRLNVENWHLIRPTGFESSWFQNSVKVGLHPAFNLNAPPFQSAKLCVFNNDMRFLTGRIPENSITLLASRSHGGPAGLRAMCRATLMIPQSPTSMLLWENAQMGNIMLVPRARLLLRLIEEGSPYMERFPRTQQFLEENTEWYSPSNQPLFIFFDGFDQLSSVFDMMNCDLQRQRMRALMDRHAAEQLDKWKKLFSKIDEAN